MFIISEVIFLNISIKPPNSLVPFIEIPTGEFFCYDTNLFFKRSFSKGTFIRNISNNVNGTSFHYEFGDTENFDSDFTVNKVETNFTIIK